MSKFKGRLAEGGIMKISAQLMLGAVLLLTAFPHRIYSQAVYGGIVGTVTDPSDASIAGAKVTVRDLDRAVTFTAVTNEAGSYNLGRLIVGRYQVRIEAPGLPNFCPGRQRLRRCSGPRRCEAGSG
ncbi:MAG: carboxypeptidase-like regulatory domain-containing protein [Gammaproteobacteria bacterium]